MSCGRLFQSVGPAAANAGSPVVAYDDVRACAVRIIVYTNMKNEYRSIFAVSFTIASLFGH